MKAVKGNPVRSLVSKMSSALLVPVLMLPGVVLAQAANFGGTDNKVKGFLDNINGLLNLASVLVVTIAVIFAGYQIAFAHKRISDVAPILIGGFLIGAAAQIAKMLIGDPATQGAMLMHILPYGYA